MNNDGNPTSDDMSQYLQLFLDETEEQLDDLVESLLILERNPDNADELNEAFRLIHSIKGAAGMMGFENITVFTHHLENHFEQLRSGRGRLDQPTMNVVLKCVDFLRECNQRLRTGQQLGSAVEVLDELRDLADQDATVSNASELDTAAETTMQGPDAEEIRRSPASPADKPISGEGCHLTITFEPDLMLSDLKARLIASRLTELGEVKSTRPTLDELETVGEVSRFEVVIASNCSAQELRAAADVDGVKSIEIEDSVSGEDTSPPSTEVSEEDYENTEVSETSVSLDADRSLAEAVSPDVESRGDLTASTREPQTTEITEPVVSGSAATAKAVETMRVDVDRLENLMNLAGQLVINRARFVQIADQLRPALRKANDVNQLRDFSDSVRLTLAGLRNLTGVNGDWTGSIRDLETGLELLEQQLQLWDSSRRCIGEVNDAIDQLTRVSDSLQRGVMETRMVPVAPLFNRFKRVVRDLATDRGKSVNLSLHGEKTELDKRMIDELAEPLMHLVRNCVDHGLEQPEVRVQRGKSEVGTIALEASHSGNNIHVQVRDDGGGIDVDKIKQRLIEQRIVATETLDALSDAQVADYIWHPGLSTATKVTDVSGRGVGMDVVNSRIGSLNGSIEVQSIPEKGTTFTIRLPLTLAIINSLLVRVHNVVFSIPIDDVREIVSVHPRDIVTIHNKQTFDVRGEFVPLVGIEDIFTWRQLDAEGATPTARQVSATADDRVDVVILHAGNKTLGLRVAELLGSQDIVIKSLAENLLHIRGLSGASILGDGTVCLMLDVGAVLDMVFTSHETAR